MTIMIKKFRPLVMCSLLLALGSPAVAVADEEIADNSVLTVTRIQIAIERPAEVVWPYVIDPSKWSDSNSRELLSGELGIVGSVVKTTIPSGEYKQVRTEELVFIEENQRVVYRVHPVPNPGEMTVTANWELIPSGSDSCLLQLDIYMKTDLPADPVITNEERIVQQSAMGSGMVAPLLTGYSKLKTVVEAETPAP